MGRQETGKTSQGSSANLGPRRAHRPSARAQGLYRTHSNVCSQVDKKEQNTKKQMKIKTKSKWIKFN